MFVSVIIPTYNRSTLIASTLRSITRQTYPHWEALIVDDGSTDNTCQIVTSIATEDSRIRLIRRNRAPKGAPTCRNIGLYQAQAEFVIFLDSDDLLSDYCLEQRLHYVSKFSNKDFWVFPMLLFKNRIDDTNRYTNLPNEEGNLDRFLRSDLPWSISCVLWQKSFLEKLNGFDEKFPNCQDHDLHLRALWETNNYHTFPKAVPDNFYRQHNGEKIYNPNDKKRILVGARMLMYRHASVVQSQRDSINKKRYVHNLSIYFKYLTKQHLFIGSYEDAIHLKKHLTESGILKSHWSFLFGMYISLAKLGFSRIKGFYRLWDVVFYRFQSNSNWGKISFKSKLHFNQCEMKVES